MSDPDGSIADPEGVPKTSDQLPDNDQAQDASAQEEEQQPGVDEEALEEEESDDVTTGGVAGQAGLGNG
jgi:hypothetical protein